MSARPDHAWRASPWRIALTVNAPLRQGKMLAGPPLKTTRGPQKQTRQSPSGLLSANCITETLSA